jgi:hypothetical protein
MTHRMIVTRRIATALIGAGFFWLGLYALAQSSEVYKARLEPLPATAKERPSMNGSGIITGVLSGTKFTINGPFEGLGAPATSVDLHAGVAPMAGVRGPVIKSLTISKATSGTITGMVDLTAQQVESLKKGGLYIQIQNEKLTDGVLWAWFLR